MRWSSAIMSSGKGGGKNDQAWEAIFLRYQVLEAVERQGSFRISADQIREYREPRLMAKFDHRANLPQIFAQHRLAILPVSRGDYLIAPFEAYRAFEEPAAQVQRFSLPASLESLDAGCIPSEAIALNCALAAGILGDFLGEDRLTPTVSGRMHSDSFSFQIETAAGGLLPVEVDRSQIEIDAALEGARSLALLEAKRDLAEDFLVRQLYYPFRAWNGRVHKRVRPVFLVYSNGIFRLYEYEFTDPGRYNSLRLVQQKNYSLEDTSFTQRDLLDALEAARPEPEPPVTFPQANRFDRVVNLCELLQAQELTPEEVTAAYDFNSRQTSYYTAAGRYLGLLEKDGPRFRLTEEGRRLMALGYRKRQAALCGLILRHQPFRELLRFALREGRPPAAEEAAALMAPMELRGVGSRATLLRRASTAARWVGWMLGLTAACGGQLSF